MLSFQVIVFQLIDKIINSGKNKQNTINKNYLL